MSSAKTSFASFDYTTATDSKVSWDWVEAATNTFGALGPHFVCAITG